MYVLHKLSMQMGNWTLSSGIVLQYNSLGENVRLINHYRIVTIIVLTFKLTCTSYSCILMGMNFSKNRL